jgi:hypothetical protein
VTVAIGARALILSAREVNDGRAALDAFDVKSEVRYGLC